MLEFKKLEEKVQRNPKKVEQEKAEQLVKLQILKLE